MTTSQIVSASIDEDFPVAGQDNDSQGFRDNFTIIKNGLATAASEITVLQENVIIKGPIADMTPTDIDNNFNETLIYNVKTNRTYAKTYTISTSTSLTPVSFLNGEYQTVNVDGNHTYRFENWPEPTTPTPEDVYAKIRVSFHTKETEVEKTGGAFITGKTYTILSAGTTDFTAIGAANNNVGTTFVSTGAGSGTGTAQEHWEISAFNSQGATYLLKDFNLPIVISTNKDRYQMFEAWTADNGETVFVKYLGQFI